MKIINVCFLVLGIFFSSLLAIDMIADKPKSKSETKQEISRFERIGTFMPFDENDSGINMRGAYYRDKLTGECYMRLTRNHSDVFIKDDCSVQGMAK